MARPDLPGFYFDSHKNRYFPISHQKRNRPTEQSTDAVSTSYQSEAQNKRHSQHDGGQSFLLKSDQIPENGVLASIYQREISGNRSYTQSSSSASNFQREILEEHTFRPRVWKYNGTRDWADGGLEQLRVTLQTAEGEVEADVMTFGGTNGCLGVWQIGQIREPMDYACQTHLFFADRCLPVNPNSWTEEEKEPPVLWPAMQSVLFPSNITSIKRLNEWSDVDRVEDGKRLQQSVIITTLGNGANGGSLYLLCPMQGYLSNPLQQYMCALPFRLSTKVTTSQSVWTSESNPRGRSASLGMSSGAAIVDLEKGDMSWLCRCSSDVLSQQFESSGNVLLCGFRNGVISTIDLRLPPPKSYPSQSSDPNMKRRPASTCSKWQGTCGRSRDNRIASMKKGSNPQTDCTDKALCRVSNVDELYCSHSTIMQMKSAICSMSLLRSSEWYLLASSMHGEIQQWDRRIVGRGPVRSFEGHSNTHTLLQLGVDPTERLLVSGGEDCAVRIWSLASGKLLQVQTGLTSPVTTVSWPTSFRISNSSRWGGFWEESQFEEDNAWTLWMGSSSGLLRMCGAAR